MIAYVKPCVRNLRVAPVGIVVLSQALNVGSLLMNCESSSPYFTLSTDSPLSSARHQQNQGLKGMRSPLPVNDGLESDTWYQVSAVSERAQGVFSEPVYAVTKTHRDPARVVETTVSPVPGSTDSLVVMMRLDCSSAPTNEACGIMRYTRYLEVLRVQWSEK